MKWVKQRLLSKHARKISPLGNRVDFPQASRQSDHSITMYFAKNCDGSAALSNLKSLWGFHVKFE